MTRSTDINAADAISTYILAKDCNRPQLMKDAFAADCELEMVVNTDAISFPSAAKGLDQVTQILVTNFGDKYENFVHFACPAQIQNTYRISVVSGSSGCRQGKEAQFGSDAATIAGTSVPKTIRE